MKKGDLCTGDIVTLRCGIKAIVLMGVEVEKHNVDCIASLNERGWEKLEMYNEDLTHKPLGTKKVSTLDIIKVKKCQHPYYFHETLKDEITD